MKRKIVRIDEDRCNGCGACAEACHEGAIVMVDGKARLIRDDFCDGLGDCLPACPVDAISIEEREAEAYDEQAVAAHLAARASHGDAAMRNPVGGCPGSAARSFAAASGPGSSGDVPPVQGSRVSELTTWPVQLKLVPTNAPYLDGAKLLIAADCTAYARADFHERFMHGHVTLIGCPKLDGVDYSDKLTEIIRDNDIKSVTVVRMQVPCCGGIERAVKEALKASGKMIPWQIHTLSHTGEFVD
ncbi:MAG: 4Fe-4S binding protein [Coriobacteriales bacterium]|nr:4Fe-4S binding protein [Coriobacteriales bacterium]